MFQHGLHVRADPFGTHGAGDQYVQVEAFTGVIDVQGQWIVGAFFAVQRMNTLPGLGRPLGYAARRTMAIVEQRTEQWRWRGNAAATLSQRQ